MAKYSLINCASEKEFIEHAVTDFKRLSTEAISARAKFCVAFSGGDTPRTFYEALAKIDLDWSKIHVFFSDERYVSHSDIMSNFGMLQKALLSHIQIPINNVHTVKTNLVDPHEAAKAYETELGSMKLDLVYLGIGPDGHTASLFPGLLIPTLRKVAAFYVHKLESYRVSLLPDLINEAREIRFLVSGSQKKPILDYIMQDPEPPLKYPCQLIRACEILSYGV